MILTDRDESAQFQITDASETLGKVKDNIERSIITEEEAAAMAKMKARHEYGLSPYIPKNADFYYG